MDNPISIMAIPVAKNKGMSTPEYCQWNTGRNLSE